MIKKEILPFCTGCTACKSICPNNCIEMLENEKGFLYPIKRKEAICSECGLCEAVCPLLIEKKNTSKKTMAYAAYNLDEKIRLESSSGGLFTEFASEIIKRDGIVYGAAYDEKFKVYHKEVEKLQDVHIFRGAKYSQSDLNNVFISIKEQLQKNKIVLFSGTPCQVAGLKSYLRKDYEQLFCIDFVCHSVPSPMVWDKYVNYRASKDNASELPLQINLRSKCTGWSRYQYSNVYQYANGREYSKLNGNDLFMKLFIGNYINRDSCANCHFKGYERLSDITLADFWGIWDIDSTMDDNKGTSLILVHSKKGEYLLNKIKEKIEIKEKSLEEASKYNPSLIKSSPKAEDHMCYEVISLAKKSDFDKIEKLIFSERNISIWIKIKEKLRSIIKF